MGAKIIIVFVLVVCTLFGGLVAPALGERCFAGLGGVQAEAISDGARLVGYRILDAEAGVVCFSVGSSLTCLDYK
jgi:hypothetical protein